MKKSLQVNLIIVLTIILIGLTASLANAQTSISVHKADSTMPTQVSIELNDYESAIKLAVSKIPAREYTNLVVNGTWYSIEYMNRTYMVSYTAMEEIDDVPELIYESTRVADVKVWILNHITGQEL